MPRRKSVNMLEGSIVKGLLAMALPICILLCISFPAVKNRARKLPNRVPQFNKYITPDDSCRRVYFYLQRRLLRSKNNLQNLRKAVDKFISAWYYIQALGESLQQNMREWWNW